MSSIETIEVSDDESDVEYVTSNKQANGLNFFPKLKEENFNSTLFMKYIEINHEIIKANNLAMQGNFTAMQSNHLVMKNLEIFNETILNQMGFNSINLKNKVKPEPSIPKSESVFENKNKNSTEVSPSTSGIKLLSNKRMITKKLIRVIDRLPNHTQQKLTTKYWRSDDFKVKQQEIPCAHCQLKFRFHFLLNRHMKSCHFVAEMPNKDIKNEPESNNNNFTILNISNINSIINSENDSLDTINKNVNKNDTICNSKTVNKKNVLLNQQNEKNLDKECNVVLTRLSCVNNKKQQITKKSRLPKKKITQILEKSRISSEGPNSNQLNLKDWSTNKNFRIINREVIKENSLSKNNKQSKILGYIKTIYIDKPMRLN